MDRVTDYTGYLLRTAFLRSAELAAREVGADAHPRDAAVVATLDAAGPLSQQHLARALNLNRSVMVKLIDGLEARGWVQRVRNPHDRRAYALHATASGLASMTSMLPRLKRAEARLTVNLSHAEHERLNALLRALVETPPTALADRTGFLLARAHHRFHERADEALAPLDLQIREFGVLTRMAGGAASQRELADRLEVSTPVVVELVDALEAKGLLERRRDLADRRLNALRLTARGEDVLERAATTLKGAYEDEARPIGETGAAELRALLRKLLGYA